MFAIVEIAGYQYKVEKGSKLCVNRLDSDVDSIINFDKVLLIENDNKVDIGTPIVEKAKVSAKVVRHFKDETIEVFKKKRRKGYQTLNGHRQPLTQIEIQDITL